MRRAIAVAILAVACAGAQTRVIGEVTAAEAAKRYLVKTDAGAVVEVLPGEKTVYLRVPPGETDLKKAARIGAGDIAAGDRVFARGQMAADEKSIAALSVIVMSKADLAGKQERDRAEWQRRGITGTVQKAGPAAGEITVAMRSPDGTHTMVVETAATTGFHRYAPDSVRFADALPGTLAEIKPGDQLRVLGEKNADGTRIKAEKIVSGSFRNVAGIVKAVDAAAGEIRINDLETRKLLTVKVHAGSTLRRLPEMMGQMLARRAQAGGTGALATVRRPPQAAVFPAGEGPSARNGAPGNGGAADIQQMLERMPALSIAELKPGDAVIVSSTTGADPARVTVIVLVAGVEPLLTGPPQSEKLIGGAWNFDIGMP